MKPVPLEVGPCRLVVVQDQLTLCPYLDGETARMPLRMPIGPVTPEVFDLLLDMGYRRSGDFLYRTQCPQCSECQPTRLRVCDFRVTRSMQRVAKRGEQDLTWHWGPPQVDEHRIQLFNLHRQLRNLDHGGSGINADSYRAFLTDTCCQTLELSMFRNQRLLGVSIVDLGAASTSAVYTFFDPSEHRYSPGTFAILRQIAWAKQTGREYVYLGMYVAANRHLNYKARFAPQQRLIDGNWVDFS
jgi:leucyl-tRNA---protein transferase